MGAVEFNDWIAFYNHETRERAKAQRSAQARAQAARRRSRR